MASSTHRDNLMKVGYRDIGFAVVNGILNGEETTLVVQMFGSRVRPQSREQTQKVTVPLLAAVSDQASAVKAAASAYSSVTKKPWIDLGVFNRTIVYVFIGVLLGVFGVDAWLTRRRRIVRVSGHSIAHIAFLSRFLF